MAWKQSIRHSLCVVGGVVRFGKRDLHVLVGGEQLNRTQRDVEIKRERGNKLLKSEYNN